jgi:Transposase zinc-ribbon domain
MKLIEVPKAFATDEMCLAYLEAKRWPHGVRCTFVRSKGSNESQIWGELNS